MTFVTVSAKRAEYYRPVGCIKGSDTMDGNDQSGALTHERDTGVMVAHSPMQLPPLVCLKYDDLIYVIYGSRDSGAMYIN